MHEKSRYIKNMDNILRNIMSMESGESILEYMMSLEDDILNEMYDNMLDDQHQYIISKINDSNIDRNNIYVN